VVAWRRQAELANDFLKKGSAVLIEGSLRSRQWENTKGEKRTTIEVVARRIQYLDAQQREAEGESDSSDIDVSVDSSGETKDEGGIDTPF
jgi:single-strand DNA-binding protein